MKAKLGRTIVYRATGLASLAVLALPATAGATIVPGYRRCVGDQGVNPQARPSVCPRSDAAGDGSVMPDAADARLRCFRLPTVACCCSTRQPVTLTA
jgi:hypothetical protein